MKCFHWCVNLSEIENILTKFLPRPWSSVSLLCWPGVIRCDIKYSNARQIPNCRNEHNINIRTLQPSQQHSSLSSDVTSIFVPTFYWLNDCKYWCFSIDWLTQHTCRETKMVVRQQNDGVYFHPTSCFWESVDCVALTSFLMRNFPDQYLFVLQYWVSRTLHCNI